MDGSHVEGVPEHESDLFASAEVGEPVPGKHTLAADDEVVTVGSDGLEEGGRVGEGVAV